MNHKRINKLLKKIANLNDSISEDDDFSKIEQDHMLSYIKKLYEEVKGERINDIEETIIEVGEETTDEVIEEEVLEVEEEIIIEEEEEDQEELQEEMEDEEQNEIPSAAHDPALEELFDVSESNELSDKLASLPVKDLTKAMGINERIFTSKQLFGGNQDEFNNMLLALNGLNSFAEAKKVLMNSVAVKYDWINKSNLKKAEHFIRLVRRRYK